MVVKITGVRLTGRGFVVCYHPIAYPRDVRAVTLDPAAMPAGSERIYTGAVVDLVLNDSHRAVYVTDAPASLPLAGGSVHMA